MSGLSLTLFCTDNQPLQSIAIFQAGNSAITMISSINSPSFHSCPILWPQESVIVCISAHFFFVYLVRFVVAGKNGVCPISILETRLLQSRVAYHLLRGYKGSLSLHTVLVSEEEPSLRNSLHLFLLVRIYINIHIKTAVTFNLN